MLTNITYYTACCKHSYVQCFSAHITIVHSRQQYGTILFESGAVSSIYIWSENLVAESEAKDGGN